MGRWSDPTRLLGTLVWLLDRHPLPTSGDRPAVWALGDDPQQPGQPVAARVPLTGPGRLAAQVPALGLPAGTTALLFLTRVRLADGVPPVLADPSPADADAVLAYAATAAGAQVLGACTYADGQRDVGISAWLGRPGEPRFEGTLVQAVLRRLGAPCDLPARYDAGHVYGRYWAHQVAVTAVRHGARAARQVLQRAPEWTGPGVPIPAPLQLPAAPRLTRGQHREAVLAHARAVTGADWATLAGVAQRVLSDPAPLCWPDPMLLDAATVAWCDPSLLANLLGDALPTLADSFATIGAVPRSGGLTRALLRELDDRGWLYPDDDPAADTAVAATSVDVRPGPSHSWHPDRSVSATVQAGQMTIGRGAGAVTADSALATTTDATGRLRSLLTVGKPDAPLRTVQVLLEEDGIWVLRPVYAGPLTYGGAQYALGADDGVLAAPVHLDAATVLTAYAAGHRSAPGSDGRPATGAVCNDGARARAVLAQALTGRPMQAEETCARREGGQWLEGETEAAMLTALAGWRSARLDDEAADAALHSEAAASARVALVGVRVGDTNRGRWLPLLRDAGGSWTWQDPHTGQVGVWPAPHGPGDVVLVLPPA